MRTKYCSHWPSYFNKWYMPKFKFKFTDCSTQNQVKCKCRAQIFSQERCYQQRQQNRFFMYVIWKHKKSHAYREKTYRKVFFVSLNNHSNHGRNTKNCWSDEAYHHKELLWQFCLPFHNCVRDAPKVLHFKLVKPSMHRKNSFNYQVSRSRQYKRQPYN